MVVAIVVAAVVVVIVVVAARCRRVAGIGDGTSAGSPGTRATLSRSVASKAGLLPLLVQLLYGNVVVIALIVVAATAGESREFLKGISGAAAGRFSRRDVAGAYTHTHTRVRTHASCITYIRPSVRAPVRVGVGSRG